MKEIKHAYIGDWKVTDKFDELYHQQVCMSGYLDKSVLNQEEIEMIEIMSDWDDWYFAHLTENIGDRNRCVFVGKTLDALLKENGREGYEGPIRIYGEFGGIQTNKTNIGKIWKAEILDDSGKVVETYEGPAF